MGNDVSNVVDNFSKFCSIGTWQVKDNHGYNVKSKLNKKMWISSPQLEKNAFYVLTNE